MGCRGNLVPALRLARRLVIGVVWAYVAVLLILGGTPWARTVFHSLAAASVLLLALRCWWSGLPERAAGILHVLEVAASNIALPLLLGEASLRALAA